MPTQVSLYFFVKKEKERLKQTSTIRERAVIFVQPIDNNFYNNLLFLNN